MKFTAVLAAGLLLAPVAHSEPPAGYHLVWSDEFNRNGLPDPTKWSYDTSGNKVRWWHDEDQYYSANRTQNARTENDRLIIEVRHEALSGLRGWVGQQYSSAVLMTRGKAKWTYGFFDIRAKLPCVTGLWPGIWLAGPTEGKHKAEIDIMEENGFTGISGTIHTSASAVKEANGTQFAGHADIADMCTAFHNYQAEWTPAAITFMVDGKPYYRYDKPANVTVTQYPFTTPEYLILSLPVDVGGKHVVDDSAIPARMEVDYVRVYQKG